MSRECPNCKALLADAPDICGCRAPKFVEAFDVMLQALLEIQRITRISPRTERCRIASLVDEAIALAEKIRVTA